MLHQLSYEELKTIVLEYPYSPNLHLLLLLKSKLDNHKDYDKNLAMAATYSINRDYLFRLLQNPELEFVESQQVLKEEDVLELKELSSLEKELASDVILLDKESEVEEELHLELELPHEPSSETDEHIEPESQPSVEGNQEKAPELTEQDKAEPLSDDLLATMNALNAIIEDVIEHEQQAEDISGDEIREISDLSETLKNFLPGESQPEEEYPSPEQISEEPEDDVEEFEADQLDSKDQEGEVEEPEPTGEVTEPKQEEIAEEPEPETEKDTEKPITKSKTTKKEVTEIASKSIKSQSRVASETLALILEKQGLHDQAIKMYEQLILTFPEKSAYFAAKIENLKNL